jgi:hypothetical protein
MITQWRLFNLRNIIILYVGVFALLFGVKFLHLSGLSILDNHPFISQDGFDWYVEGVYLVKLLQGHALGELPILRPPTFVFVTAVDYVVGGNGVFIAFIYSVSIFLSFYFLLMIAELMQSGSRNNFSAIIFALGMTIYPLNFVRPYLLADCFAGMLSIAAVYTLLKAEQKKSLTLIIFSGFILVIAGLTQTYAMIPYLILCLSRLFIFKEAERIHKIETLLVAVASIGLYVLLTYLWRNIIPHVVTPDYFSLLEFSSEMFPFYLNTWSYFFLPFILFFIFSSRNVFIIDWKNINLLAIGFINITLFFLIFIYQWPESRFTFYIWPWFMLLFTAILYFPKKYFGKYFLIGSIFLMVFLAPINYWAPKFFDLELSFKKSWVYSYFQAASVDRRIAQCTADCRGNIFLNNSDAYVNSVIKTYLELKDK